MKMERTSLDNLGVHPPNYGLGWEFERGRRGRYEGFGSHGGNGGYRQVRNFQLPRIPAQASLQQRVAPQHLVPQQHQPQAAPQAASVATAGATSASVGTAPNAAIAMLFWC